MCGEAKREKNIGSFLMGKLDSKVAIVTGASGGIGRAVSQLFASEGCRVVCASRTLGNDERAAKGSLIPWKSDMRSSQVYDRSLSTTVAEIQQAGGAAVGVQTDVCDEESCDYLVWSAKRVFGRIDVLVNDAAVSYFGIPVKDYPVKWWLEGFATNVHGPFMLSRKVLPDMIDRHSGAIINISSGAAAGPGRGPYTAPPFLSGLGPGTMYGVTKAAIERLTQGLAQEVYKYGVSVACVAPSFPVDTPGTVYHQIMAVLKEAGIKPEPIDMLAKAILLLATEPLDKVTGRVTYSQAILKEFGWISEAHGFGVEMPGSGFSRQ
jgi:citronellol/citronellal dehydrogenase